MKAERKQLSMERLIASVSNEFVKIDDPAKSSSKFSIRDCLLSGLGMFYLKSPSLLQFVNSVKVDVASQNIMNLYGVSNVPSDTNFRVRLDKLEYGKKFQYCFDGLVSKLQRAKILEDFKYYKDYYLVAIDGSGYFSSDTIHCDNCCVKEHKHGKKTYYHHVLAAVMVCPGVKTVLPLGIEPIIKQDGVKKNDCEINAAKRLLQTLKTSHPNLKLIFVMDALYANGPLIKLMNELDFRYIITGKDLAHMYDEFKYSGKAISYELHGGEVARNYKFANGLELNATCPEVKVNYLEYNETPDVETSTKKKFFSSWITDLVLERENVYEIMRSGRSRWSIENETFNTLKNLGYNFEHNYGHGHKNLSVILCHLMFIAFLIDQIQAYCGHYFKLALEKLGAKKYIWEKIRSIWHMVIVKSWQELYETVINAYTNQIKFVVSSG